MFVEKKNTFIAWDPSLIFIILFLVVFVVIAATERSR